jgi:peptide subunit release factor 1 (eRF1)
MKNLAKPRAKHYLVSMQMSQQHRIYDVLSIRPTSASQERNGSQKTTRTEVRDRVHEYFAWLTAGPISLREKAWAKHARGRLA